MATLEGGASLKAKLAELAAKVAKPGTLNVGFLEGSTESESGLPSAYIASIHEFGGTWEHPGGTRYITDAVIGKGESAHIGTRFVGKDFKGDTLTTKAHKFTIPARPFFRPMIADGEKHWGSDLGKVLVSTKYNVEKSLKQMGEQMQGELVAKIDAVVSPPLKPETVRRKGFDKPLVDTGDMRRAVNFELEE